MFSACAGWLGRFALWAASNPDTAAEANAGQLWSTLLMVGALVVIFYFFIIRPESKRKKAAAKMRNELIVGDTITTIGGITGRVISIKDDTLTIETGPDRTKFVLMRWAMQSKGEQISDNPK